MAARRGPSGMSAEPRGGHPLDRQPGSGRRNRRAPEERPLGIPDQIRSRRNGGAVVVTVAASQHADAQLFAEVLQFLRVPLIRGSTNRGGVEAVRRVLRGAGHRHLTVTPDGPRGPRRQVQPGIAYLGARTGMPIVPLGFAYDRPWRLPTWDQFAVPRPWSLSTCVTAPPVVVPPGAGREQLAFYRRLIEGQLHWVSAIAERWAETGCWPQALVNSPPLPGEWRRAG